MEKSTLILEKFISKINVQLSSKFPNHAKQAEVELKIDLEMMGRDKKTIQELIALVDPPKKKQII